MDITRFDAITRTLAERKTRRSTIAGVAGIAGVSLLGADNAGPSPRGTGRRGRIPAYELFKIFEKIALS
jgi:hypothetical protein